jgi:hypothetical protein
MRSCPVGTAPAFFPSEGAEGSGRNSEEGTCRVREGLQDRRTKPGEGATKDGEVRGSDQGHPMVMLF